MLILNIGCKTKTSDHSSVINIDWSIYLKIRKSHILNALVPILLSGSQQEHYQQLKGRILIHDLRRGIPFKDKSVDVVYNSHFLEHLDRDSALSFLDESKRVLIPGGILRIVVPDMEKLCKAYISHLNRCELNTKATINHDDYIAAIIEQCVRQKAWGTSRKKFLRRLLENMILGDARRRGETHKWMYDRISLNEKLKKAGFSRIRIQQYDTSEISNWNEYGLDVDDDGSQYKPGSLYIEAKV